jgi:DnaD/phage-associated family protein
VTFGGFPARAQATAIPNVFFSDLLPELADASALGVVLYAFNVLSRKKGFPRYVTAEELASEPGLAAFLAKVPGAGDGADAERAGRSGAGHARADDSPRSDDRGGSADAPGERVRSGLRRAAEVGVLLPLTVESDGRRVELFFLNAPADRRGMEAVRSGTVDLGRVVPPAAVPAPRSSVFALYESLVGTLSPLIADELAEAERLYPAEWLEAAFREAAAQNARSWRYVSRILERWAIEGPDHAKTERGAGGDDRYFSGKYGRILKQRLKP